MNTKHTSTVILIPGFWLGGWAWDEVAQHLRDAGLTPVPVTLPGLDSPTTRRDGIRLADHVDAVLKTVRDVGAPVVLVAHSGAGMLASAVLDQVPELVSRVVYVDSGPVADGTVARPDLDPATVDVPLPAWDELEAGGASLAGLSEGALRRFRTRAVPHPAGPLREPVRLQNPRRNDVPATIVCCSMPSGAIRGMAVGGGMFAPLADLTDVCYVDLPTGHWPMWSAPAALAKTIARAAHL
ncbi:MAG: alpha/beta hydrolase [Propionibacteriaceae bacterium]|nr:alpha/beta hydrolase [Propionibacteriaceae bacterium]